MQEPRHGRYAVLRCGQEWRLFYGSTVIGVFDAPEIANAIADKLCRAVANVGFDVDLTRQTPTGELRRERIRSGLAR
jgi:hypothetical protein